MKNLTLGDKAVIMKRRAFIQKSGLGTSGILLAPKMLRQTGQKNDIPVLRPVTRLEDAINRDGRLMIRIEYRNAVAENRTDYKCRIRVRNGKLERSRHFFFEEGEDSLDQKQSLYIGTSSTVIPDIVVFWLEEFNPGTVIELKNYRQDFAFSLQDLLEQQELEFTMNTAHITVNYLLDKEIGELDLARLGIEDTPGNYVFALLADPQGGDPSIHDRGGTRLKIHNAWLEQSVQRLNELEPAPLFNLVAGDVVDAQGQEAHFKQMERFYKKLKSPVLYEIGNHESKYNSSFSPGYNQEAFRNYYESQKRMNGTDKLLYSFNLGKWHYVVWPDPLRNHFWERHPHYFDWLERDLEKHKARPTMVFHHVPAHPIGIDPLTEYVESPYVKRLFTDILAGQGNVRYVISGHVHIPLRASIKTAVEYRGMKFINLPAAGYRPRAFGEEDLFGGPSEGVAVVRVNGEKAGIEFMNVTRDVYTYPGSFPAFNKNEYPFWYHFRWELPKEERLMNGDFSAGPDHWKKRFIYMEDQNPGNIQEVQDAPGGKDEKALYLYSGKRGFDTAGQDRLAQSLNRVAQIIRVPGGKQPELSLDFMLDKDNFDPETPNGCYIWLEGYEKSTKRLNITYSAGYHYWPLERNYSQHSVIPPMRMEITAEAGIWHALRLNPWKNFRETTEMDRFYLDNIDRFIINLGVWTINDGFNQQAAIWFANLDLKMVELGHSAPSLINGSPVQRKDDKFMYWGGADHVAGEHITHRSDMDFYRK